MRQPGTRPRTSARVGACTGQASRTEGSILRPNRLSYRIVAAAVIAGVVLVAPGPAYAAAPTNDTFAGATAIGAVPFSTTVDTSEATTDADDAEANANCGAPSTDASVWFSLAATTNGAFVVDVSASSYSAGVLVVTG